MKKTKICKKCQIEKPLADFSGHNTSKDGYRLTCKSCNTSVPDYTCKYCGKVFRPRSRESKYCSRECSRLGNSGDNHHSRRGKDTPSVIVFKCDYCGKEHSQKWSVFKRNKTHYCSPECRYKGISKTYVGETRYNYSKKECTCGNCGAVFLRKKHHAERRRGNNFCSKECYFEWSSRTLVKDARYNYRKDITDEERQANRDTQEDILFRRGVFARDNHTCVVTGQVGGDLVAHHLDGYDWCWEKRYDISNGVTLAKEVHVEFHSQYGFGGNTKEQFDEFISKKLNNHGNTEVTD